MPARRPHVQITRLADRPLAVLAALMLAQWAAVASFAFVVRHNGWLYYQGGDQTFFYTASWAIAGGHIPESAIGYGWSYLTSPVALAAGPDFLAGLPALVLLQTLVLLPVALYCVYAIAANVGGRPVGYFAAVAWVALPFAVIPLWDQSYHAKYVEQFLPQAFGMTGLGDFPSMVCLLVAALFCIRVLDTGDRIDALLAGVSTGFAIGIKPANALFLAGPALAFVAARRLRSALEFSLALLVPLLTLALWKYRGLGHLPILTPTPKAATASSSLAAAGSLGSSGLSLGRYLSLDWSHLGNNYLDLRRFFWGVPLLQSLPLAGFAIAAWRSFPKALLLGGWVTAFVLVKGSSDRADVAEGTFLHLFMPGFPPLLILSALIAVLIPTLRRQGPLRSLALPARTKQLGMVAVGVFALIPLVLFAVLPLLGTSRATKYFEERVMVPVDQGFSLQSRRNGRRVLISWKAPPSPGARVFYRVFRSRPVATAPDPTLPPGQDGIRCLASSGSYARAADCRLEMSYLGTTRSTRFADRPPPGRWAYRVGLAANSFDDPTAGDVLLLSRPARVASGR